MSTGPNPVGFGPVTFNKETVCAMGETVCAKGIAPCDLGKYTEFNGGSLALRTFYTKGTDM